MTNDIPKPDPGEPFGPWTLLGCLVAIALDALLVLASVWFWRWLTTR
jgi:hypothetical protein